MILSEFPAIGLWRLDTGSSVFDREFQGLIDTIRSLNIQGPVPVTMTITTRESRKGPGEVNSKFPVVSIAMDAQPVPFTAMVSQIQQKALARPTDLGSVPVLEAPKAELPMPEHEPEDEVDIAEIVYEDVLITDPTEWVRAMIGNQACRDWASAFEGAGKDWPAFCARAMRENVSVQKIIEGAGKYLGAK